MSDCKDCGIETREGIRPLADPCVQNANHALTADNSTTSDTTDRLSNNPAGDNLVRSVSLSDSISGNWNLRSLINNTPTTDRQLGVTGVLPLSHGGTGHNDGLDIKDIKSKIRLISHETNVMTLANGEWYSPSWKGGSDYHRLERVERSYTHNISIPSGYTAVGLLDTHAVTTSGDLVSDIMLNIKLNGNAVNIGAYRIQLKSAATEEEVTGSTHGTFDMRLIFSLLCIPNDFLTKTTA